MSFAEYLLERGAVSPEDLLRCVDYRRWLLPFVGTLAANRGYLRAAEVLGVVEECERRRCHFGEVAVEKGYLVPEQVEELLEEQSHSVTPLRDCLIRLGILTRVQAEDLEAEFENRAKATEHEAGAPGLP